MALSAMARLRTLFDPYIALMLATVVLATVVPATGRGAQIAGFLADAGIVFLFFLYGTRLSLRQAWEGLLHWRLQLSVLAFTFGVFPLLGAALTGLAPAGLPYPLIAGVLFLCVLPSTVQSSIAFTSIARGNVAAALCAASASNLIGVLVSPLLAGWLLHARGVELSLGVFRDIVIQLLLPFLLGQMLRPIVGGWVQRRKAVLHHADRGTILLIIYVAFSRGMAEHIWQQVARHDLAVLVLLLCLLLALVLLLTALFARHVLKLAIEDEIVLQFCGSKKSLASGLPMASVLFPAGQLGLAVLPLMLFHQLQLLVCAVLARRYAARH